MTQDRTIDEFSPFFPFFLFFFQFSRTATDLRAIASGKPVGGPPTYISRQEVGRDADSVTDSPLVSQRSELERTPGCGVAREVLLSGCTRDDAVGCVSW